MIVYKNSISIDYSRSPEISEAQLYRKTSENKDRLVKQIK